jgi:5-methylcytosine-specific restriction endonuclease McrA
MPKRFPTQQELKRKNNLLRQQRIRAAREIATHTDEQWWELVAEFDCRCACCGAAGPLAKDHIIPIYQGGSDGIDNIQPLCRSCNSRKGPDNFNWVQHRRGCIHA